MLAIMPLTDTWHAPGRLRRADLSLPRAGDRPRLPRPVPAIGSGLRSTGAHAVGAGRSTDRRRQGTRVIASARLGVWRRHPQDPPYPSLGRGAGPSWLAVPAGHQPVAVDEGVPSRHRGLGQLRADAGPSDSVQLPPLAFVCPNLRAALFSATTAVLPTRRYAGQLGPRASVLAAKPTSRQSALPATNPRRSSVATRCIVAVCPPRTPHGWRDPASSLQRSRQPRVLVGAGHPLPVPGQLCPACRSYGEVSQARRPAVPDVPL